jgi:hypothetical protein
MKIELASDSAGKTISFLGQEDMVDLCLRWYRRATGPSEYLAMKMELLEL